MLKEKFEKYLELLPTVQDSEGFIDSHECDSLLFSCLLGSVPGVKFSPMSALASDGKWHRRPCSQPCYPEHSKSTISRDMLLGLAWYAYRKGRLDISEQVVTYALSHYLVMGKGPLSRTFMTPGLLSTFAWISYRLGGPSRALLRLIPHLEGTKNTGFQAHLSVLHILLRQDLGARGDYGHILVHHADRQPSNPLFQYAAGRLDNAKRLLTDPVLWPEDRLPTSWDRKASWLLQRDAGDDWKPATGEKKIFSGGDFLFVYALTHNLM